MVTKVQERNKAKAEIRARVTEDANHREPRSKQFDAEKVFTQHGLTAPWNTLMDACLSREVVFPGPQVLPPPAKRRSLLAGGGIPPWAIVSRYQVPEHVFLDNTPSDGQLPDRYTLDGLVSLFNGLALWAKRPKVQPKASKPPVEAKVEPTSLVTTAEGTVTLSGTPTGNQLREIRERAAVSTTLMAKRLEMVSPEHLERLEGFSEGGNPNVPVTVGDIEVGLYGHGLDGVLHAYALLLKEAEEKETAEQKQIDRQASISDALASIPKAQRVLWASLFENADA